MAASARAAIRHDLAGLMRFGTSASLGDGRLLDRFAAERDERAFEALLVRHSPMVLAVCRTYLEDAAEADDAFQTAFLTLVRKARTIRSHDSLESWLYRVTRRVALSARRRGQRTRRSTTEGDFRDLADPRVNAPDVAAEQSETALLIRDELARLPERYRLPIELCDLDELTREQAAQRLGWPAGTVAGRLARGRALLKSRLARRGLTGLSAAAMALQVRSRLAAAMSETQRSKVIASALAELNRPGLPAFVAALVKALRSGSPRLGAKAFAAASAMLLAGGLAIAPGRPSEGGPSPSLGAAGSRAPAGPTKDAPSESPEAPDATASPALPDFGDTYSGRVLDPSGKPVEGARIHLTRLYSVNAPPPSRAASVRALTDAAGRFSFQAPDMAPPALDGRPQRLTAELVAFKEGFGIDWVKTMPGKALDLTLNLVADQPIRGRIVDLEGRPVAGAEVILRNIFEGYEGSVEHYIETTMPSAANPFLGCYSYRRMYSDGFETLQGYRPIRTDADGRFELRGVGADRFAELSVRSPRVETSFLTVAGRERPLLRARSKTGVAIDEKRSDVLAATFTAPLKPPRSRARGIVVDAKTKAPVPGVVVGDSIGVLHGAHACNNAAVTDRSGGFDVDAARNSLFARPPEGSPYVLTGTRPSARSDGLVIELSRGVPYALKVIDQATGKPIQAQVDYFPMHINIKNVFRIIGSDVLQGEAVAQGTLEGDGSYRGAVLPGPGVLAVRAKVPRESIRSMFNPLEDRVEFGGRGPVVRYQAAHADPRKFFPLDPSWKKADLSVIMGDDDFVVVSHLSGGGWLLQRNYDAIIYVNPAEDSAPLMLEARLARDPDRTLALFDPEGKPLEGVEAIGLGNVVYGNETVLRTAEIPLSRLSPDRKLPVLFLHRARKLIGFMTLDGAMPLENGLTLNRWGEFRGKIVDRDGQPIAGLYVGEDDISMENPYRDRAFQLLHRGEETNAEGAFVIDRLLPDRAIDVIARTTQIGSVRMLKVLREKLAPAAGETIDLGEIRLDLPRDRISDPNRK